MFNLLAILGTLSFLFTINDIHLEDFVRKPESISKSVVVKTYAKSNSKKQITKPDVNYKNTVSAYIIESEVPPELLVSPTAVPTPSPKNDGTWGKAKQLSEHTWTIAVGQDSQMASPGEILNALNAYRNTKGRGNLDWDQQLADYSQQRSDLFNNNQKLDDHAGFMSYFTQDKMKEMGLRGVGENSAVGYTLTGTHFIEWVFAGDAPHDNNQLNGNWNVAGIAISGNAVNIIFGVR